MSTRRTSPSVRMPLAVAGLAVWIGLGASADDWSAFRGPNGSGIGEGSRVPDALDPETNLKWRVPVYPGFSSPVIQGESIFLTAHEGTRLFTVCLDRETGRTKWTANAPEPIKPERLRWPNSPVSPTAAADDERVYVVFENFGIICYDHAGAEQWRRDIGPWSIPHGMSTSPILHDDKVILLCDQDSESYLIALDRETGETAWKTTRDGKPHGYATPAISGEGDDAIIVVPGAYELCAYAAGSGEKIWWADGMAWQAKTLPVFGDDTVYVNASMVSANEFGAPSFAPSWTQELEQHDADDDGRLIAEEWNSDDVKQLWFLYDLDDDGFMNEAEWVHAGNMSTALGAMYAVKLGGDGNVTTTHIQWKYDKRRGLPDMTSPLLHDGVLYLLKGGGIFTAMDPASGAIHRQERVGEPAEYAASPIAADGRIVVAGREGQLAIIEAGPEWKTLSEHVLDEDLWATPAIAGGNVYVRTQEALYCFEGGE